MIISFDPKILRGDYLRAGIINMSYLTDSYISFTLKLESGQNFAPTGLLGQVHMVKKIFLKFLHAGAIFFLFILLTSFEENHKFSNKNNHLPAWRKIRNIFFTICT